MKSLNNVTIRHHQNKPAMLSTFAINSVRQIVPDIIIINLIVYLYIFGYYSHSPLMKDSQIHAVILTHERLDKCCYATVPTPSD